MNAPSKDRWNLSSLFSSDKGFYEQADTFPSLLAKFKDQEKGFSLDPARLKETLDLYYTGEELLEKLSCYASLRLSEDVSATPAKELFARASTCRTQWGEASSFLWSTLGGSQTDSLEALIKDPSLKLYQVVLKDVLRQKAHTLSTEQERLLALQSAVGSAGYSIFSQLTNADFVFGSVKDTTGQEIALTQGNFGLLLESADKDFRERVYQTFYRLFEAHQNTLCETLHTSLKQNWFTTQARNYKSNQERALFADAIPGEVYSNLTQTVRSLLPSLHEYYALKAQHMGQKTLSHADVYVPFVQNEWHMTYEQAVDTISESFAPLGADYQKTVKEGLLGGWVDRYERAGKRSGAFSSGTYTSSPYILMNYKESSLRDVYTLAHEAGHSMHTRFTASENPFPHYRYAIFEAEVASTFNEQLLTHHLLKTMTNKKIKEYILAKSLDDMVATFFRQTMFGEFESRLHAHVEKGLALTPEGLKEMYGQLQKDYFGASVTFFENSWLECVRIPHFYSPFYVYQYATGISASLSLSEKVLKTSTADFYLDFLKRGGSVLPFDSLKMAGVDLTQAKTILEVGALFKQRLSLFKTLLSEKKA